jgi:Reverse transcriptase (RNA-dependent DNA polymerase)
LNVDDTSHNPRLQRELYRLCDSNRQVVTMQPNDGIGVSTRSSHGTTMTQVQSQECEVTKCRKQELKPLVINPRTWSEEYGPSLGLTFTQYSMNKGLKLFGNKGTEAVRKEMEQLDKMSVLEPISPSDLTLSEREKVLEYLMFLKEKRCGKIKGRGCADGRLQRLWTDKHDTSSPTAYLESLLLTASVDAKEGRKVATVDIPGAFLHVDQDEVVHIRLRGEMARLLGRINPDKYEAYILYERQQPVLYAKLNKCLYGTLKAALQFWKRLSKLLKSWGFDANEYDPCVVNKTINGSQCTVLWHVDDLKISHLDLSVIEDIVAKLNDEFGKFAPLTATYGDVHEYLGMTLDFSEPGKVKIIMEDYIKKVLSELDEYFNGIAATPATNSLFKIRTEAEKLSKEQADKFHTITANFFSLPCGHAQISSRLLHS